MTRILVADDDEAITDATKILLEEEGFDVVTVTDGKRARIALNQAFDIVLLDIWMPGIDGRDICNMMKNDPRLSHIPVLMVSASRDTETISRECGAIDFIVKPFDINELLEKVRKYC